MFKLSPKDPVEAYVVEFNFSRMLTNITQADCSIELLLGEDEASADVLDGLPQVIGTSAYQRVRNGKEGCTYKLKCTVTGATSGQPETYTLAASLKVVVA
jgi:hypothetical protein